MLNKSVSSQQINLPQEPTLSGDAATKEYVDTSVAIKVNKAGDTLTGPLILAADPTVDLEAATKQYVDNQVTPIAADITSTPAGSIAADNVQAALEELDTEKLPKAGGTLTGSLILHADPTTVLQAVTKQYADKLGSWEFTQSTPATQWTINHPLGRRPKVTIYDSTTGAEVIADVVYNISIPDVVVINFKTAFAGKALLT